MSFPLTTVIAVDVSDKNMDMLKPIHRIDFLAESEIHLVHAVQEVSYGDDLAFNVLVPYDQDRLRIKDAVIAKMKLLSNVILPYAHSGKVHFHCIFGDDAKDDFCRYLHEVKADLAIVATREKRGLFQSSFAYHVGMHAPASVFIIRSNEKDKIASKFKGRMHVAVGVKLDEDLENLSGLKKMSFLKNSEIHFLHMSRVTEYGLFPELRLPFYPSKETQLLIEHMVRTKLESAQLKLLPENFEGKCHIECAFSSNIRKAFCEKMKDLGPDLVILSPGKTHKHFGSFIQYQLNYSGCNLFLLRS